MPVNNIFIIQLLIISKFSRSFTMLKSCLKEWRPTEALITRSGCSGLCTTCPGCWFPPDDPVFPNSIPKNWPIVSGNWSRLNKNGSHILPVLPFISGLPWSESNPRLEWHRLPRSNCLLFCRPSDPIFHPGSNRLICWLTPNMSGLGPEVPDTPKWDQTMLLLFILA